MDLLSSLNRPTLLNKLEAGEFDLLIIGGGITGAGIALDAATRGLRTALVEKQDFAGGTSSRSTKLIHGGLRYLKQGEIGIVREVGRERAILYRNAPHLIVPERMLLPLVKQGTYGTITTAIGLRLYDILASVKPGERRKMLSKKGTLKQEPLLNPDILKSGCLYSEYRADDARLTIEILKTAVHQEALCANYTGVESLIYENGKAIGAKCVDKLSGKPLEIKAKLVVNAAGPWVDELREMDNSLEGKRLHHTKGTHVVVPHERLPVNQAIYFDVFDGRMVFTIPRGKSTYIGTTDTDYSGDLANPKISKEDAKYLISAANKVFSEANLKLSDVVSSWAGIRPLIHQEGKSPSEISRKDEIFTSASGLISIAGGKLTGYRIMAKKVTDLVVETMHREYEIKKTYCKTERTGINGGDIGRLNEYTEHIWNELKMIGLGEYEANYLIQNYGKQSEIIIDKISEFSESDSETGMARAELWYCIMHESLYHLEDFFFRRTGRMYFDIQSIPKLIEPIAKDMGSMLGWDAQRIKDEVGKVNDALAKAVDFK